MPVNAFLRSEYTLPVSFGVVALYLLFGADLLYPLDNYAMTAVNLVVIFATMLSGSFSVIRHADALAVKLGEPYGTLLLTLSVITIEVVAISMVMVTGGDNPTLARDMMFAVLMIVLNGLVGVSLLIGGWKYMQQQFNLQGISTYLAVLSTLAIFSLVLPIFTRSSSVGTFSYVQTFFVIVVTLALYGIFLGIQTIRHKDFFTSGDDAHHAGETRSLGYHAVLLVLYMLPIVILSKKLAVIVDFGIGSAGAPAALGGMLVAILVLSPEGLASINAARHNNLQRSMNICFGSALATISLTVPAVLLISLFTGETVVMGLGYPETVLLIMTLFVSTINFNGGRSNVLHGALHLVLFMIYLLLIFD
jgi:Ca2+:H+ antiporter